MLGLVSSGAEGYSGGASKAPTRPKFSAGTAMTSRAPPARPLASAAGEDARYALANGCYALRSKSAGRLVAKDGSGYVASADVVGAAEGFRMQATALGSYLLYGRNQDFVAADAQNDVVSQGAPSGLADWRVDAAGPGSFKISLPAAGKVLTTSGNGSLALADSRAGGAATLFGFEPAQDCAVYPEVETRAEGRPIQGRTPWGEVKGLIDSHMHMMAYEFLGGMAHCGRPWHSFGAPFALVDCPDHYPANGAGAVLENVLYGNPARTHDPVGWPTFKDWPQHASLTHEQTYYKWLERAWRGGLRVFVNLLVENRQLCEIYPYKKNSCDEMSSVRLQAQRIRELENYIDAQNGGPGRGWFRIVTDPFQARREISRGKLAVVLGIEVSEPFGCRIYNDQPLCDRARIDRELNDAYGYGVRDMELINKFDNALGGVAGDTGTTGAVVNSGNKLSTGKYWDMRPCTGPPDEADKQQPTVFTHNNDEIVGNGLAALIPGGAAPIYMAGPHCNTRGLTDLGEHLVRQLMAKRMIVDPDHLSVRTRKGVMSLLEAARYSGVISSHSWSTPDVVPRIYNLGGVITPYAGDSTDFVKAWKEIRPHRNPDFYYGLGWGADQNGFGGQGAPRNGPNPVTYPFKSFDGGTTFDRQKSGLRLFDINKDGVAHYGLYPDWLQDVRNIAGNQIIDDMSRGAEAYLQMWERANGIRTGCKPGSEGFSRGGLGAVRLGYGSDRLLQRAGQPRVRGDRAWSWCAQRKRNRGKKIVAVLDRRGRVALVASSAYGHPAGGIRPGARTSRLRGKARRFGRGVLIRRVRGGRFIYVVRRGRVRYVAVATRAAAKSPRALGGYLKLTGLR